MIRPLYRATRHVSNLVADAAGHPAAQLGVLVLCIAWWALGGSETVLASSVSIGSFVLPQRAETERAVPSASRGLIPESST